MSELGLFDLYTQGNFGRIQDSIIQKKESIAAEKSIETGEGQKSFMETLEDAVGDTNETLANADKASLDFASGKDVNLHDVMIAMEKADVSLRT
jgi:flagellar hook-basal body complex protein FliE